MFSTNRPYVKSRAQSRAVLFSGVYIFILSFLIHFPLPIFQTVIPVSCLYMSNTEPLDIYLTHVKVHFVHTLPAALPINREAGALKWGSDLNGGKVKHHSTWGLWDNSGVKWNKSSSHSHILLQSWTGAGLAPSCDRLRKSLGRKPRKPPERVSILDSAATQWGLQHWQACATELCMTTPGASLPQRHLGAEGWLWEIWGSKSSQLLGNIFVHWS